MYTYVCVCVHMCPYVTPEDPFQSETMPPQHFIIKTMHPRQVSRRLVTTEQNHFIWGAPPPSPPGTSRAPASASNSKKVVCLRTTKKTAGENSPVRNVVKKWGGEKKTAGQHSLGRSAFIHICVHMYPYVSYVSILTKIAWKCRKIENCEHI